MLLLINQHRCHSHCYWKPSLFLNTTTIWNFSCLCALRLFVLVLKWLLLSFEGFTHSLTHSCILAEWKKSQRLMNAKLLFLGAAINCSPICNGSIHQEELFALRYFFFFTVFFAWLQLCNKNVFCRRINECGWKRLNLWYFYLLSTSAGDNLKSTVSPFILTWLVISGNTTIVAYHIQVKVACLQHTVHWHHRFHRFADR